MMARAPAATTHVAAATVPKLTAWWVLLQLWLLAPRGSAGLPALSSVTCELRLVGKNPAASSQIEDSDTGSADQGVADVRLACVSSTGSAVPISINSTWLKPQHVAAFKGVVVVSGSQALGCQQTLLTRQVPIFGLLHFCGDYQLTFTRLDISGLHIHSPAQSAKADKLTVDGSIPWSTAVVVVGGSVRMRVSHARITRNSAGSAFLVMDTASLSLERDVVASHNRGWAGPVAQVAAAARVVIHGSRLSYNYAHNTGGACIARGTSSIHVTGGAVLSFCRSRVFGGALQGDESARLVVDGGSIIANCTAEYGGGVAVKNGAQLLVKGPGTTLIGNKGFFGGATAGQQTATITFQGARLIENSAQYGGCSSTQNSVENIYDAGTFATGNTAQYGAVAAVADTCTVLFDGNTTMVQNEARWKGVGSYGGIAAAAGRSTITFRRASAINNTASCGGVAALQNTAKLVLEDGSLLQGNSALQGGGVCGTEFTETVFGSGSRIIGNTAPSGMGGAAALESRARLIARGTLIANNTATVGGGIATQFLASLQLEGGSIFTNNYASQDGGAVHIGAGTSLNLSTPGVAITGSSQTATGLLPAIAWGGSKPPRIFGNRAGNKGGGVFLDSNNHAAVVGVLLNMVSGNTAKYDPDLSVALQHIEVLGPRLVSISSRLNRTSGTLNVTVKLTGPFGVTCGGWRVQAALERVSGVLAAATSDLHGVAVLRNIKVRAQPGMHTLLLSAPDAPEIKPAKVVVGVRTCILGEVTNVLRDGCETCGPGYFSLNPANLSCDSCPVHATCGGGSQIVPDEKFWSSSSLSTQMQLCPNPEACTGNRSLLASCRLGGDGDVELKSFAGQLGSDWAQQGLSYTCGDAVLSPIATQALLCAKGYSGNVCGQCAPGYGQSAPFTCHPCLPRKVATLLYVAAFLATLLVVRLLTLLTMLDNNASAKATAAAAATSGSGGPPAGPQKKGVSAAAGGWCCFVPASDSHSSKDQPQSYGSSGVPSKATTQPGLMADLMPPGLAHKRKTTSHHVMFSLPQPNNDADSDDSDDSNSHSTKPAGAAAQAAGGPAAAAAGTGTGLTPSLPSSASLAPSVSAGSPATYTHVARASDILQALVLYVQYLVIVAGLRVNWPATLSIPIKGLTWFYSVGSSQVLALECLYDTQQFALPTAMQRQLFYTLMPLAVFGVLWLVEAAVRVGIALLKPYTVASSGVTPQGSTITSVGSGGSITGTSSSGRLRGWSSWLTSNSSTASSIGGGKCSAVAPAAAASGTQSGINKSTSASISPTSSCGTAVNRAADAQSLRQRMAGAYSQFWTTTLVLAFSTVFFLLPSLARSSLSLFACIPLDDPKQVYSWAALAPGSHWAADPNQRCWSGWHAAWALSLGAPLAVLVCAILPLGIALLVTRNRHRLDSPDLIRRYGFLFRPYRPSRAAWEAVVVWQTVSLCVVSVFGLALGPYYQTLTMTALCAFNIALLLLFTPHKHRQQHQVLLFAFTCMFVMCFTALTLLPSYDGKSTPHGYAMAIGTVVLLLNVVFVSYGLWQLKISVFIEYKGALGRLRQRAGTWARKIRVQASRRVHLARHRRRQRPGASASGVAPAGAVVA